MPASFAWFEVPDEPDVCGLPESASSVEGESATDREEEVQRRTLLAGLALGAAAASGVAAEPWQRLTRALDNPSRLGDADVDHLERETADYFRREEFVPARQLAAGLREHVERINRLLAGSPPDRLRIRLLSTIGESLALYGWFAFDRGDHPAALRFYGIAATAARDANDDALTACVLAYRSYLAEAAGHRQQARDLLVAAQQHATSPTSAATRSWLAAREAEVRADLAETTGALTALERAKTAYDYARPQHERAWTAFFTGSRLGSMAVTTYTRLDHRDLDATADGVLAALSTNEAKTKAIILADLAAAAVHRGTYDHAATLATDALAVTTSQEVSLGADRLRHLRRLIAPRRNVATLANLDERLAAALG